MKYSSTLWRTYPFANIISLYYVSNYVTVSLNKEYFYCVFQKYKNNRYVSNFSAAKYLLITQDVFIDT